MDFTYTTASIRQYCAMAGTLETPVRTYHIAPPQRYAQPPTSVRVYFLKPRNRSPVSYNMVPDNLRYLTIEVAGQVVYDSRTDVPCDMAKWTATNQEWQDRRPCTIVSRPLTTAGERIGA